MGGSSRFGETAKIEKRRSCEHFERCGLTGHYFDRAVQAIVRCPCLQREVEKQALGKLYCENPLKKSPLQEQLAENLVIDGPIALIKKHLYPTLLELQRAGGTFKYLDAYRLIEIFLEKDAEYETVSPITESDLLILLLGFGEIKNQRLPDCIQQVLERRGLDGLPTWVVLGVQRSQVSARYGTSVGAILEGFREVTVT